MYLHLITKKVDMLEKNSIQALQGDNKSYGQVGL
jgi:hypothetical protein